MKHCSLSSTLVTDRDRNLDWGWIIPVVISSRRDYPPIRGESNIWNTFPLVDDNLVVVLSGGGVLHLHHGVARQHPDHARSRGNKYFDLLTTKLLWRLFTWCLLCYVVLCCDVMWCVMLCMWCDVGTNPSVATVCCVAHQLWLNLLWPVQPTPALLLLIPTLARWPLLSPHNYSFVLYFVWNNQIITTSYYTIITRDSRIISDDDQAVHRVHCVRERGRYQWLAVQFYKCSLRTSLANWFSLINIDMR